MNVAEVARKDGCCDVEVEHSGRAWNADTTTRANLVKGDEHAIIYLRWTREGPTRRCMVVHWCTVLLARARAQPRWLFPS
jgi:hypothetical protein